MHGTRHRRANSMMSQPQDQFTETREEETGFFEEEFPVIEWGSKDEDSFHSFDLGPEKTARGRLDSPHCTISQAFKRSFVPAFLQEEPSEPTVSSIPHCVSFVSKKQKLSFEESSPVRSLKRSKSIRSSCLCSMGSSVSAHLANLPIF
jgi:hypothetical protein